MRFFLRTCHPCVPEYGHRFLRRSRWAENRKDPAERNYREFEEVFNRARELSENSGDETSEDMANLIETYNSVVEGGWLS